MSNQKILEKALLKAHKNGWNPLSTIDWENVEITQWQGNGMVEIAFLYHTTNSLTHWVRELEGIIYNHDFARALWGEGEQEDREGFTIYDPWKYHLQEMVIADNPIKYIEVNI